MSLYENQHSILGDFEENFQRIANEKNSIKAYFWYWWQVLQSFPEYFKLQTFMGFIMFKNYLKIAFRNIKKNKSFTFINVSGLAAGIVVCILILFFVQYELSYEDFQEKADNIYRIGMEDIYPDNVRYWGWTSVMLAEVLTKEYPEVVNTTRILTEMGETQITYKETSNIEKKVMYADSNFFNIFTNPLIMGDPKTVLQRPYSVVITNETAKRYFGSQNPIGKTIKIRNWWANDTSHTVTGISESIPKNSHFHYDFLISYNSTRVSRSDNFDYTQIFNYILLQDGFDPKVFETKLPEMVRKYEAPVIEKRRNISYDQYLANGYGTRLFLQPLKDIHLKSNLEHEIEPNGNITFIYMFSIIATFIMIIASINFMNLSTARSINRAREVGVRKALGSIRKQLIGQFLFESIILSFLALIMAIGIFSLILPIFQNFTGADIQINYLENPLILPGLFIFAIFIGILSGSYPAFFLSSFKPIAVLKGVLRSTSKGNQIRNGLVVFQFTASIALIASTLIIKNQIDFMLNKDLGYNKDHVIVLSNGQAIGLDNDVFKNELKKNPNVISIAGSGQYPAQAIHVANFKIKDSGSDETTSLFNTSIDDDFIETLKMEIIQGRGYSREMTSDTGTVILSEAAVKAFGLKNPIGRILDSFRQRTIIGVFKDFHFRSLHNDIGPLVLFLNRGRPSRYFSIRVRPNDISGTLTHIKNVWDQFAEGKSFNYSFMDQDLEQLYHSEAKTSQISAIFSILAILIGCLGLFGLANYAAEQRTKEIGVRKVLGASIRNILVLLSKEYTKLVVVAFVIAVPISYYIMNNWLHSFAFRTNIAWQTFLLAGILTLFIALVTICYQVIKAANRNPVDSLRYE